MGFTIEDGSGDGFRAKVDNENRLHTHSVSQSLEHHTNTVHGDSYNFIFSGLTASGTNSCVLYIKNISDNTIMFEGITLRAASDEIIEIALNNVGTVIYGTNVTPANINAGSSNQAEGVFQTSTGSTAMAGITTGTTILKYFISGGGSSNNYNFEQDVILPKNRVLTMYCVNGNIQVDGFLAFFFHHTE
jgi:hypothetical protein